MTDEQYTLTTTSRVNGNLNGTIIGAGVGGVVSLALSQHPAGWLILGAAAGSHFNLKSRVVKETIELSLRPPRFYHENIWGLRILDTFGASAQGASMISASTFVPYFSLIELYSNLLENRSPLDANQVAIIKNLKTAYAPMISGLADLILNTDFEKSKLK